MSEKGKSSFAEFRKRAEEILHDHTSICGGGKSFDSEDFLRLIHELEIRQIVPASRAGVLDLG